MAPFLLVLLVPVLCMPAAGVFEMAVGYLGNATYWILGGALLVGLVAGVVSGALIYRRRW